jgi:hypothetical protein
MSPTVGVPGPRMALAVVLGMRMAAHTTAEIADELADLPLDITFAVEDRTCEEFARWLLLRQRTGCLGGAGRGRRSGTRCSRPACRATYVQHPAAVHG